MIILPSSAGIYRPYSAAAWTPANLPLLAWYSADSGVLDASDNPITADSTAVKTWQDQSGNARHLVQNTSASRPVFRTVANSFSSLPALEASGSQFFENTTLDLSGGLSLYVVCKLVGTPTLYTGVFQFGGGNAHMVFNDINNAQYFRIANVGDIASGAAITNTRQVLKAVINGATWKFKQSADGQSSATHTSTINPGTGFKVFQNYVGTATCQISEFILCSRELTSGEEASLNNYLKTRYAVDTNAIYFTLPVSGAALWLDGSRLDSLYTTDTGSTNVTTNAGAIGRWEDLSGNARHAKQATAGSRPTWSSPANGRIGLGAVNFNGSQHIFRAYNTDLGNALNFSGDFTIEAWVKFNTLPSNNWAVFNTFGSTNQRWIFFYDSRSSQGVPGLRFLSINASNAVNFDVKGAGTSGWSASTWYHVAVCRSGNNIRLFRDGTQNGSTLSTSASFVSATSGGFYIGCETATAYGLLNASVQNTIIYNGQALYTSNFTPFMS